MSWSLESHLGRFHPDERRLLLKWSALYADQFKQRVFGGTSSSTISGEEILRLTLRKIAEGSDEYAFREGDILLFHCLCRCCRRTVLDLYRSDADSEAAVEPPGEDDTPIVLTEHAAAGFLQLHNTHDQFLAFLKSKRLSGKLRAYAFGFPGYAADRWDAATIAKALRVTPAIVANYRSRLRELIEEFELQRMREHRD